MATYTLQREVWIPHSRSEVFGFFARAENLEQITPSWMRFRILTPTPLTLREGSEIAYALRIHGIPLRWLTLIERWNPPIEFVDVQIKGPYKLWRHTHRFKETAGGTLVSDTVTYQLPWGLLGRLAHQLLVARDLRRIFDYRARRIQELYS